MKNLPKLLICFCLVGMLYSCEKEIPYLGDEIDDQLVLVSYIEAGDDIVRCSLSKTASILNNDDIVFFTNANVQVSRNGNFIGTAVSMGDGWYEIPTEVAVGDVFSISAHQEGFESVTAETKVPAFPSNFELVEFELIGDDFSSFYRAQLRFNDPDGTDYYQLLVYEDNDFSDPFALGFSSTNPIFQDDSGFGESEWFYFDDGFFSDELFDGNEVNFDIEFYAGSSEVKIQLIRCSREFYLYQKSLHMYRETSGDFFAQPVQIFSNVENGLGVVGAYSFSEVDPF
ncbi:MAG: DUF4249 domain-containing protein [Flavobacteriales bacterium]|jgi:hypothetical protein|nr:DUF4249 domain-containing protein [Flavobacteriales bacterium]